MFVGPYSTCVSAASFVDQLIVAVEVVVLDDTTFEMVGAVTSGGGGVVVGLWWVGNAWRG